MEERLQRLAEAALAEIAAAGSSAVLDGVERTVLGRKGELAAFMRGIGKLAPEQRASFGRQVNEAKAGVARALEERRQRFRDQRLQAELGDDQFDPTEPPLHAPRGHLHPITLVRRRVEAIFLSMGFDVMDGPEVETEEFNFDRLNIPPDHPARDLQDSFWLESGQVLRTHTSGVQLRAMLRHEGRPPVRVIAPGRVFRNEQPDATHEHTFHQVEGLMVDESVSVADMKGVLQMSLTQLMGASVDVRLRPCYFPFVEPGFEMDMRPSGSGGEWLEMLGCGLVHPRVLAAGGMDPRRVSGFAFGLGLDRVAMLLYGIDDIRWMMRGDLRFQAQF